MIKISTEFEADEITEEVIRMVEKEIRSKLSIKHITGVTIKVMKTTDDQLFFRIEGPDDQVQNRHQYNR